MDPFIQRLKTASRLGFLNVSYVLWYRLSIKLGIRKHFFYNEEIENIDQCFKLPPPDLHLKGKPYPFSDSILLAQADDILKGNFCYFNNEQKHIGMPPDWFYDPFTDKDFLNIEKHWADIPDFEGIDIKCIWELSRFDWTLVLTRAFLISKNQAYFYLLNLMIANWIENNPADLGPNWKCGQEAAIRSCNLLLCWHLLGRSKLSVTFELFLVAHAQKIEANIRYAISQDNNHATSEGAGLYLISLALKNHSPAALSKRMSKRIARWGKLGRKVLERSVNKLIMKDGSFSQNSLNYHRVILDTLNLVETFNVTEGAEPFSQEYYEKVKLASLWLYSFVDENTGDGPNLGANDGAYLYKLTSSSYRDFRPTLQLSGSLFLGRRLYEEGSYDEPLWWLKVECDYKTLFPKRNCFEEGGYGILENDNMRLFIRAPKYKFRPSQADAMHVDLWIEGQNYLVDSGSYSYNDSKGMGSLLKSAVSHNTIVFDGKDPMRSLSKFLYSDWLNGEFTFGNDYVRCSYLDYRGYFHQREIIKIERGFKVLDEMKGDYEGAELFWHLGNHNWEFNNNLAFCPKMKLEIICSGAFDLSRGFSYRSLNYQELTKGELIKVSLGKHPEVTTEIRFLQ